jgi:hypothetical protein
MSYLSERMLIVAAVVWSGAMFSLGMLASGGRQIKGQLVRLVNHP